ncbi:quercetin 2,3-dioxygenase [Dactylosporangium sp. NPDC051484]|uniref:quercetin 2,3-dioxygenase n=1 Tax=Dactylosporangium sp. NPDC051484 TaxID=3154942 RepID=UPI003450D175
MSTPDLWDGLRNGPLPGDDSAYVLPAGEAPRIDSLNLLFSVLARKRDTAGAFSLLEMAGARGAMAPAHSHGDEAEAFYLLEGRMDVHVAELSRSAAPGDFVYIPKATRHAFEITSASAKFLCLIVPGGFEDYFLELGALTDDTFPREPHEFAIAAADLRADVAARHSWRREPDYVRRAGSPGRPFRSPESPRTPDGSAGRRPTLHVPQEPTEETAHDGRGIDVE